MATLVQAVPGEYVVELQMYALDQPVGSGHETARCESALVLKHTTTIYARRLTCRYMPTAVVPA